MGLGEQNVAGHVAFGFWIVIDKKYYCEYSDFLVVSLIPSTVTVHMHYIDSSHSFSLFDGEI
jgi:hypothetical protein